MPFGSFLDTLPPALFIATHVAFLGLGIWAVRRSHVARYSTAFWLYAVSQAFFLGFFAGALTLKMAVLIEQMLIAGMVIAIAMPRTSPA